MPSNTPINAFAVFNRTKMFYTDPIIGEKYFAGQRRPDLNPEVL